MSSVAADDGRPALHRNVRCQRFRSFRIPVWNGLAGHHFAGMQLDETLFEHLVEKTVHVLAQALRLDLELVEERRMRCLDRGRVLKDRPYAGADRVEAEIGFAFEIQNY